MHVCTHVHTPVHVLTHRGYTHAHTVQGIIYVYTHVCTHRYTRTCWGETGFAHQCEIKDLELWAPKGSEWVSPATQTLPGYVPFNRFLLLERKVSLVV